MGNNLKWVFLLSWLSGTITCRPIKMCQINSKCDYTRIQGSPIINMLIPGRLTMVPVFFIFIKVWMIPVQIRCCGKMKIKKFTQKKSRSQWRKLGFLEPRNLKSGLPKREESIAEIQEISIIRGISGIK